MTAIVTVEDPDTFNGPLTLKQTWRKNEVEMAEMVCAENDGGVLRESESRSDSAGRQTGFLIGEPMGGSPAETQRRHRH